MRWLWLFELTISNCSLNSVYNLCNLKFDVKIESTSLRISRLSLPRILGSHSLFELLKMGPIKYWQSSRSLVSMFSCAKCWAKVKSQNLYSSTEPITNEAANCWSIKLKVPLCWRFELDENKLWIDLCDLKQKIELKN